MEQVKKAFITDDLQLLTRLLNDKPPRFATEALRFSLKDETIVKNTRLMRLIVNHGAAVNGLYKNGKSLVSLAISHENLELVKFLIGKGADVNKLKILKKNGKSELELAVSLDRCDIVECLLDGGADVHQGKTYPLCRAIDRRNLEMVKLLLRRKADINGRTSCNSPLLAAVKIGNEAIVKFLLEQGAANRDKRLLFLSIITSNNVAIVKLLLDYGCDPNVTFPFVVTVNGAIERVERSLLSEAVGHVKSKRMSIELLLDYGARMGQLNAGHFDSELHLAVRKTRNKDIVKLLIERGVDLNIECLGKTALEMVNDVSSGYNVNFRCRSLLWLPELADSVRRLFVRRMVVLRSQGLFVSERNWNVVKSIDGLGAFENECEREIELLRSEKFDDSNLSCYDVLTSITNLCKIADLARNENIVRVVKSNDFVKKFPIYGDLIVKYFDKGILRNRDFELVKRFFNYLSTRKTDKLPRLPLAYVSELYNYLNKYDVDKLRNL